MKKQQHLRSLCVILMLMLLGISSLWAETVTFDATAQGYSNAADITAVTEAPITFAFDKGTSKQYSPKYYTNGNAIRCYGGNTITISGDNVQITGIIFTFGSDDGSIEMTANCGSFESPIWTGAAEEVVFSVEEVSGNRRVQKIEVTYVIGVFPAFLVSKAALDFGAIEPNTKKEQTFTVSGQGLKGNITLSAPAGVTLNPATLVPIENTVAETTVTATWAPTTFGTLSGDIIISTEGTDNQTIAVSGICKELAKYTITFQDEGEVISTSSVVEGGEITFPEDRTPDAGWQFAGWSTKTDGVEIADIRTNNSKPQATVDAIYNAIYSKNSEGVWNLVTQEDDLIAGDIYTIGNSSIPQTGKVLGKQYNNNIKATDWNTDTKSFMTFVLGGSSAAWTMQVVGGGFLYAPNATGKNDGNYLRQQETLDDKGKWSIKPSEGAAEIKVKGGTNKCVLRYNGSGTSDLFSCYAEGQSDVYLFKKSAVIYSTVCTSADITIDDDRYASYYNGKRNMQLPEDKEVYAVTYKYDEKTGKVKEDLTFEYGDIIPAGVAVLLYSETPGTYTLTATESDGGYGFSAEDWAEYSDLYGCDIKTTISAESGYEYYILASGSQGIGFYNAINPEAKVKEFTCNVHKAYLRIPAAEAAPRFLALGGNDTATAIGSVTTTPGAGKIAYNLAGQKVGEGFKGIIIVNGKKIINK